MTEKQIIEATAIVEESFGDLDVETKTQITDLITSRFEFPVYRTEILRNIDNLQYALEYYMKNAESYPNILKVIAQIKTILNEK